MAVALDIQGTGLQGGTAAIGNTTNMSWSVGEPTIVRVHILDGGLAAEVQVRWDNPHPGAPKLAGFLTLLQHTGEWVVIAAVTAATESSLVMPADFAAVAAAQNLGPGSGPWQTATPESQGLSSAELQVSGLRRHRHAQIHYSF